MLKSLVGLIFGLLSFYSYSRTSEFVIVSLGDSITTANNARSWGDSPHLNWSTGSTSNSHFKRLENVLTHQVRAVNVAKTGASSEDITAQVTEALSHNPDYVTLLIGANDVCSWPKNHQTYLENFEKKIDTELDRFITQNQQVKILLVPVPDMLHLYELGKNSCGWLWDFSGACSALLSSSRTDEERLAFKERLDDLNESLSRLHKKYEKNSLFPADLAHYKFSKEDVSSKDCFHPSMKGQELISELTWKEGFFAN